MSAPPRPCPWLIVDARAAADSCAAMLASDVMTSCHRDLVVCCRLTCGLCTLHACLLPEQRATEPIRCLTGRAGCSGPSRKVPQRYQDARASVSCAVWAMDCVGAGQLTLRVENVRSGAGSVALTARSKCCKSGPCELRVSIHLLQPPPPPPPPPPATHTAGCACSPCRGVAHRDTPLASRCLLVSK